MGVAMGARVRVGVKVGIEVAVGVSSTDTSLLHGPDAQPRSTSGITALSCVQAHTDNCSEKVMRLLSHVRSLGSHR